MISKALVYLLWFAVWLLLSWPPNVQNIITGAIVALVISFMTMDISPGDRKPSGKNPMRYLWFIHYVIVFAWECIKSNIDVAYRVIHPDLPIRPGTVKVRTSLRSDTALTFLANSITLTPGTTTVDIDKDKGYIYIHWLYVKDEYRPGGKLAVVEKFENILKRIFE